VSTQRTISKIPQTYILPHPHLHAYSHTHTHTHTHITHTCSPDKAGSSISGSSTTTSVCGASAVSSTVSASLAWDSKEGRAIRQLENRLTKAQLKANEAQSIRRMYEQVGKCMHLLVCVIRPLQTV